MFKRRDWRLFNRDDGNSSSDSDSDVDNDGRGALDKISSDSDGSTSDSEGSTSSESGDESNSDNEKKGDDSSDSDDEDAADTSDDDDESEETPTVLTHKIDEQGEQNEQPKQVKQQDSSKGIAVKCSVCPGVLCLSEKSLQQHLDSKKHKKQMAKQGVGIDDEDVLVDAAAAGRKALAREAANRAANGDETDSDIEGYSDGEAETHAERLARLRTQI